MGTAAMALAGNIGLRSATLEPAGAGRDQLRPDVRRRRRGFRLATLRLSEARGLGEHTGVQQLPGLKLARAPRQRRDSPTYGYVAFHDGFVPLLAPL